MSASTPSASMASEARDWGDLDRCWPAANYLTVGQIYLQPDPLPREPRRPEHVKPRLLGRWGTSPGLSLAYVHLNRNRRSVPASSAATSGYTSLYVHGFVEEGTTTTPFDMVLQNQMSRYHLALDAVHRARSTPAGVTELMQHRAQMLDRHHDDIREHVEDMPEVRDGTWT